MLTSRFHRVRDRHRDRSLGQSMVEFAIVFPVILLLLMVAIDFGRVYLGWVNLQNMTRIAANFAANNATDFATNDAATITRYRSQVRNDATASNCQLLDTAGNPTADAPLPTFSGFGMGDTATVEFDCQFSIITPVIKNIFDNGLLRVSASSAFPVKSAIIAAHNTGGGGGGGGTAVTASFSCAPTSGAIPLAVICSDESGGNPTSWNWVVSKNGTTVFTSGLQDFPFTLTDTGAYDVTLTVDNALGQPDDSTRIGYLHADVPSVVAFDADKYSGKAPLTVNFIDQSSNNPTTWAWDFDGNGTTDSTQQNPSHQYTQPGSYNVTLTVTNAAGPASLTKLGFINVDVPDCLVPSMTGKKRNVSLGLWTTAGFTQANFHNAPGAPNGNFTVTFQSITAGSSVPCTSVIEVNG